MSVEAEKDRLKSPLIVPIEELIKEPYASVLCFPKPNEAELQTRIEELRNHGVSALEFSGKASLYGVSLPVLGKGFVGIVVIAYLKGQKVAVKIRRDDADRADLLHEAHMLSKANSANVAPKLFGASKNFLLMQLIDGDLLPAWIKANREKKTVQAVFNEVFTQCYRLDEIGLDHGELSKAPKHVIIDHQLKPWLVDFETSSDARKPANVSALGNFLFTSSGEVARDVAATLGERNKEEIIQAMKNYRKERTRDSFEHVLQVCLDFRNMEQ
jgi:putative serine/threonine protein kinase